MIGVKAFRDLGLSCQPLAPGNQPITFVLFFILTVNLGQAPSCGMQYINEIYQKAPTTNHPLPLFSHHYHVRHGLNVSFITCRGKSSESCSPLFYWFLDFTTRWCASSKIHQNFTIPVRFFPFHIIQ